MNGNLFDVQRFSIHDGPGIRTLIFFKGCNMACSWCQNPESQKPKPEIMFNKNACQNFGDCFLVCAEKAISLNPTNIDFEKCNACGKCVEVCPTGAFMFIGKNYTANEVFEEIEKDIPYYGSTGGVTFSGGEATTQIELLDSVLDLCKKKNIHTNLETNGLFSFQKIQPILKKLDLIFFDLKIFDSEDHKKQTGVDNSVIKKNAETLQKMNFPVQFRIPLIQEITDTKKNLESFLSFFKSLNIREISLLKFHNLYETKLDALGRCTEKTGLTSYPLDKYQQIIEFFQDNHILIRA